MKVHLFTSIVNYIKIEKHFLVVVSDFRTPLA